MAKRNVLHVELNEAGVRELLQSAEMQAACMAEGQRMAGSAGAGYSADARIGRNRVIVRVKAETQEAINDNLKNNTLLKVMK
jgi:hypothetical protein